MEGDTTAFYIHKRIKDVTVRVSVIARGVPVGGDLEYADEITLGRSILSRTLFQ
jgi:recombination protein RecR